MCTKWGKSIVPGSPVVKTLPFSARGVDSIPGLGAKSPCASYPKKKKNQKQYCNKFNKDFKNNPHKKNLLKKNIRVLRALILFVLPKHLLL